MLRGPFRWLAAPAALLLGLWAASALAQEGFSLIPEFSHVISEPGKEVAINLRLTNPTDRPLEVALELSETPGQAWRPQLRAAFSDFEVRRLSVPPPQPGESPTQLRFSARVPDDAQAGDYPFTLLARAGPLRQSVPITVSVRAAEAAARERPLEVETRFPLLRGPTTATFEFSVTLRNRTPNPTTVDLDAVSPEGWTVAFKERFGDKLFSSISLDANGSESVAVQVTPRRTALPGEYPIRFFARAARREVTADFGVVLTGAPQLRFGTLTERLNVTAGAGKETSITLVTANAGTSNLGRISFLSSTPSGWKVTFEPEGLEELPREAVQQIVARVKPPSDAVPGDYTITLSASAPESAARIEMRVSVTQSTVWGWVGLVIALAVVGGLAGLFMRLGRR